MSNPFSNNNTIYIIFSTSRCVGMAQAMNCKTHTVQATCFQCVLKYTRNACSFIGNNLSCFEKSMSFKYGYKTSIIGTFLFPLSVLGGTTSPFCICLFITMYLSSRCISSVVLYCSQAIQLIYDCVDDNIFEILFAHLTFRATIVIFLFAGAFIISVCFAGICKNRGQYILF